MTTISKNLQMRRLGQFGPARMLSLSMLLLVTVPKIVIADALTDGSVGPSQNFTGDFTVPQSIGSVRGNNLFHSFTRFNVDATKTATFKTDSASLRNVITRVTGGERSSIFGTIKLNAASGSFPDFYFLNPAGVVFGSGATLDVPGGFHVSTAQKLKFSDGFSWDATAATASALTVAAPEAFGFLGGASPASIVVNDLNSSGVSSKNPILALKDSGKILTFAAGDILINSATVKGNSGNLRFVAQGSMEGDIKLDSPTFVVPSPLNQTNDVIQINQSMGTLDLINNAEILANTGNAIDAGTDAGTVEILARQIRISKGAKIDASTSNIGSAGIIDIKANSLVIDNKGGTRIAGIFNEARETSSGNLNTGQIKIIANELSLINGQAQIQSFSASKAATPKPASKVDILVRNLFVDGGEGFGPGDGAVGIFSESLRNGFGGIVKVVAQEGITLRNFGQIATNVSDVLAGQTGKAGTVIVEAKTIDIVGIGIGDKDKTGISSSAGVNSLGHPGTVSIKAKDWIHVSNTGAIAIRSGSTTAAATNQPTTLTISASNIELNNGRILSSVSGEDSGGRIVINAGNQLKLTNGSSITSEATDGNGGPIVINAENSVRLRNSKITSSVTGKVNGNGGDIDIGGKVLVMESGFIQANTTAPSAQGGKVNISVQRLVANGGNAFIGGTKIQDQVNDVVGFNVIQAAAPEGVAGNLLIANPEFDISGTLLGLALPAELGALSQDLCEVGANSSFTSLGRITSHSSSKDPISP